MAGLTIRAIGASVAIALCAGSALADAPSLFYYQDGIIEISPASTRTMAIGGQQFLEVVVRQPAVVLHGGSDDVRALVPRVRRFLGAFVGSFSEWDAAPKAYTTTRFVTVFQRCKVGKRGEHRDVCEKYPILFAVAPDAILTPCDDSRREVCRRVAQIAWDARSTGRLGVQRLGDLIRAARQTSNTFRYAVYTLVVDTLANTQDGDTLVRETPWIGDELANIAVRRDTPYPFRDMLALAVCRSGSPFLLRIIEEADYATATWCAHGQCIRERDEYAREIVKILEARQAPSAGARKKAEEDIRCLKERAGGAR